MMKCHETVIQKLNLFCPVFYKLKQGHQVSYIQEEIDHKKKGNTLKGASAKNTDSFPESGVEVIDLGEDTSLN